MPKLTLHALRREMRVRLAKLIRQLTRLAKKNKRNLQSIPCNLVSPSCKANKKMMERMDLQYTSRTLLESGIIAMTLLKSRDCRNTLDILVLGVCIYDFIKWFRRHM